jgi:hypothetical protein
VTGGAQALARLLRPGEDTAIELGGTTAVLESIAGTRLEAEVLALEPHELTAAEAALLRPGRDRSAALRRVLLRTSGGIPAAEATVILLANRVPAAARTALGITKGGRPAGGRHSMPLGTALRGMGVRREQLEVTPTPGRTDAAGAAQVLHARAVLHAAAPIALVDEWFFGAFLEAFPVPGVEPATPARLGQRAAAPYRRPRRARRSRTLATSQIEANETFQSPSGGRSARYAPVAASVTMAPPVLMFR